MKLIFKQNPTMNEFNDWNTFGSCQLNNLSLTLLRKYMAQYKNNANSVPM